ncbi:MAG: hypothetical protein PHS34_09070, partial [Candidatus Omnitrophica bacterium]|nr:hypothetical protein [Candidatus Omnitrophota bacterium]
MTKESIIQRHVGLSSATKPVNAPVGSTYYEYDTNDTYITIDSGSTWVVKDSKSTKKFKTLTVLSATGAYASGDILSNSEVASSAIAWTWASVAGYNGGSGRIVNVQVETTEDTPSAQLQLYLFNGTPSALKTDNLPAAVPLPGDVSTGIYLG